MRAWQLKGRIALVLLLLTGVSGLVDATSYLTLGHVFVANLTGNVLFVGFSLAGASGFSIVSSIVAVAAFFTGAVAAARLARAWQLEKPELLMSMAALELFLVLTAILVGLIVTADHSAPAYAMVALMAGAVGIQSATTSWLRIPGFNSTVVLTTMIGTMAAASRVAGGSGADNGRRMLAVGAMLFGGFIGAALALRVSRLAPLTLAAVILVIASLAAHLIARVADRPGGRS